MLTEEDQNYMVEILTTELGASGSPRQALAAPFYNSDFAKELAGDNPRILAIDAIRLCMKDGWDHDPTWLATIIETFSLMTLDEKS